MTNSEKIKAYLDAGHKVRLGELVIYGTIKNEYIVEEEEQIFLTDLHRVNKVPKDEAKISIHQEPLPWYPKVGDKVVILESARLQGFSKHVGEVCIVAENNHYGCLILIETTNNKHLIDYRHLAPYID